MKPRGKIRYQWPNLTVTDSPRKTQRVAHLNRLVQIWYKNKSILKSGAQDAGAEESRRLEHEEVDDQTALQLKQVFLW